MEHILGHLDEICNNCGLRYGAHGALGSNHSLYCPGHEGYADWDTGLATSFNGSGYMSGVPYGTPAKRPAPHIRTEDQTDADLSFSPSCFTFRGMEIPDYMREGLIRYITHRVAPGSFLIAVLENNLTHACSQADDNNMQVLPAYVAFLYNHAPSACWGSPSKVKNWINQQEETDDAQP